MAQPADGARGTNGSFPRSLTESQTNPDVVNSVAPNEDLAALIGDHDDDDFGRDVSLSNEGEEGKVKEEEDAKRRVLTEELKEELRSMEEMQESLVREVVLRGR